MITHWKIMYKMIWHIQPQPVPSVRREGTIPNGKQCMWCLFQPIKDKEKLCYHSSDHQNKPKAQFEWCVDCPRLNLLYRKPPSVSAVAVSVKNIQLPPHTFSTPSLAGLQESLRGQTRCDLWHPKYNPSDHKSKKTKLQIPAADLEDGQSVHLLLLISVQSVYSSDKRNINIT